MSIDFYSAKDKCSIAYDGDFVEFKEELQNFLYKKKKLIKSDVEYIYKIDPYCDTEFDYYEIKKIMDICTVMKIDDSLCKYEEEKQVMNFFDNLEQLCKKAIEMKEKIFAIGD